MAEDKLQAQRLELKYIINEDTALRVRDFVSSYLELDEFGASLPNYSYPVHSLYLDSPDLRLYQETINGTKNRYKLRLRFYDNRPDSPIYFEIKRRMNNCIMKQRGGVRRAAVDELLAGHIPDAAHLTSKDTKPLMALQNFCALMHQIRATPKAHIAYFREAWVSHNDNSIRVTLDREVKCEPEFTTRLCLDLKNPAYTFGRNVVLELKFTNSYPLWFRELIQVCHVMQSGAAKYVEGVAAVGEHRFSVDAVDEFWIKEQMAALQNQVEPEKTGAKVSSPESAQPSLPERSRERLSHQQPVLAQEVL